MKLYIASAFKNCLVVQKAIQIFQFYGHTITHDWTHCHLPPKATDRLKKVIMGVIAQQDIQGVVDADAIIYIAHPNTRGSVGELTAGIVLNKYCFLVGEVDVGCMPECHPSVAVCKNIEEVLQQLSLIEMTKAPMVVLNRVFNSFKK